jgi:hypothetical protein
MRDNLIVAVLPGGFCSMHNTDECLEQFFAQCIQMRALAYFQIEGWG